MSENIANFGNKRKGFLNYYVEILNTDFRIRELTNSQKKVIGIFCNFVPLEIIYAFGCIPIRLCAGSYDSISLAENIYPRDVCPLVKSSLGLFMSRQWFFKNCDLIILPIPCDAKKKMYEILNKEIPTILLNIPMENKLEYLSGFVREIKKLIQKLEKITGTKIKRKKLLEAITLVKEAQKVFRELHLFKKRIPSPISGKEYMMIYQACFYDDILRWTSKTKEFCQVINTNKIQNLDKNKEIRILLSGAPLFWPNFKLINIIEQSGAKIVVDELCSATRSFYDLVEIDEYSFNGLIEAICARYLLSSTCPCFIKSDNRIDKILSLYREFNCMGIVYHSLRLCQLHDIDSMTIKKVLKEEEIPFLQIHTDYSQEDIEQIKTRVEAFIEILRER
jgi:benzoyl-CoA reductase/2-hydroxyglutaryl-CoA dehydratase subunit BcrC/BadD/HgdB